MSNVAGASRFLNQAILAQKNGATFSVSSVLSVSRTASILDAGRGNAIGGVGLSSRARALNSSFLANNSSTINQMFSLSGGTSATTEASIIQIAGLKATAQSSRDVIIQDDGTVKGSLLGSEVDTSV